MGTQPNKPSQTSVSPDPNAIVSIADLYQSQLEQQIIQQEEVSLNQWEYHPVVGVLGGLPVAEKNQEYFAVVFEAGDTSPELIDQTQYKVTYLCDSALNVSKPSQDTIALNNINQNFERQKLARVRVDQGTVLNNQLQGLHEITAVGSLVPIAGTQIGKGPRAYVTTMSFVLKDQLGAAPGVEVAGYYLWFDKSVGYQNLKFAKQRTGTITYTNEAFTISGTDYVATPSTPLRTHYDSQQRPTGSAVQLGTDSAGVNPPGAPASFDADNYFNRVKILTGSLQGNTRVRAKVTMAVTVATSSVHDLYMSAIYPKDGPNDTNTATTYQYKKSIKLKIIKEADDGTKEVIAEGIGLVQTYNASLGGTNREQKLNDFSTGTEPASWGPNANTWFQLTSDYISVSENDKIYAEIEAPEEESTGSLWPPLTLAPQPNPYYSPDDDQGDELTQGVYSFTSSLSYWRNTAAFRSYNYFGGLIILNQETPSGSGFIQNVTGVTASYIDPATADLPIPSASVYNWTGSYWVGYNNFSSSEEGIGSYITSSTALANFYGGDYIQVNPGTEIYNVLNADSSPTSSLFEGPSLTKKFTWNRFGFNPIKDPFTPKPTDFIRFEYSKSKVFQILAVNSSNNVLTLKLDKQISEATILDNFVIYRIIEDGQYIILDVAKNKEAGVNQAFSGIITAQYPSENLEERQDRLIFELKQAGIISDQAYLGE